MNYRFVTKDLHAYLDYPVAASLMVFPILLNLGESHPLAMWLSIATGVAARGLTLLTDHRTGVLRIVPYSVHLAVDAVVGVVFLAAPFIFGFTGLDTLYYLANGGAVMTVVSLHKPSALVDTQPATV